MTHAAAVEAKCGGFAPSLTVGLVGLGLCGAGWVAAPDAFYRAYLPACLFWLMPSLGALVILMIHELTGGAWGRFIRPPLKAAAATLPLVLVLWSPLLFGLERLFPWVSPGPDWAALVEKKQGYLNLPFFLARTGGIFLVWLALASALSVWRAGGWEEGDRPQRGWSAAGLILYGVTVTLFAVDWVMSLEPRWHSASFGLLIGSGSIAAALGLSILTKVWGAPREAPPGACAPWPDLGNLLLAAIVLWGYLAFNQFLTIWSENLPDKILWYRLRAGGGWPAVAWTLAAVHVFVPFTLLISRWVKCRPGLLAWAAVLVLTGRALDTYWLVSPAFYRTVGELSWQEPTAFAGIGGVWLALFLRSYRRTRTPREAGRDG